MCCIHCFRTGKTLIATRCVQLVGFRKDGATGTHFLHLFRILQIHLNQSPRQVTTSFPCGSVRGCDWLLGSSDGSRMLIVGNPIFQISMMFEILRFSAAGFIDDLDVHKLRVPPFYFCISRFQLWLLKGAFVAVENRPSMVGGGDCWSSVRGSFRLFDFYAMAGADEVQEKGLGSLWGWIFCHFAMLILSLSMVVTCLWNPLLLVYVICKVEPPEDFPDSMPLPPVEKGRPPRQVLRLSLLWSLSLQKSNHATWKWWFSTTLKNQSPQTEDFSWIFSMFFSFQPRFLEGVLCTLFTGPGCFWASGTLSGEQSCQRRVKGEMPVVAVEAARPSKELQQLVETLQMLPEMDKRSGAVVGFWLGIWGVLVISCGF